MIWYDMIWMYIYCRFKHWDNNWNSIYYYILSLSLSLTLCPLLAYSIAFCLSVCLFPYFIIVKDSYKISYDFLTSKVKLNLIISNTHTHTPSLNTPYPGSPLSSPPKPTQVWSLANSPSKFYFHLHWHIRFIYIQISFIFSIFLWHDKEVKGEA